VQEFEAATRVIAGDGALEAIKEFKAKRLLVVTDPYFMENGMAAQVGQLSKAEQVEIFSKVQPDPSVELAAEGTATVKRFDPDLVVALGGGSTMDCAKAMVYFARTEAPLVAVPTTSGSGSEVTDFAILSHSGVKHPLVHPRLRPKAAILDSRLLEKLPKQLIADTGFDVLCHAAESVVATGSGMITRALARDAFRTVYGLLPASFAGDTTVRLRIHTAATMAGMAFTQSGLGICHALSHALGGMFHVPHGRLNAILLPAVIGSNAHAAGEEYARLAAEAGMGGSAQSLAVRNLKNGLIRLRRQLQMPDTLYEAGVDLRQLRQNMDALTAAAQADPCSRTNPLVAEAFILRRILEEVSGHG